MIGGIFLHVKTIDIIYYAYQKIINDENWTKNMSRKRVPINMSRKKKKPLTCQEKEFSLTGQKKRP